MQGDPQLSLRFLFRQSSPDFRCVIQKCMGVGLGVDPSPLRAAKNDALILQQKGQKQELFLLSAVFYVDKLNFWCVFFF